MYTGSKAEKLDWDEGTIKARAEERDSWDKQTKDRRAEMEAEYRKNLPLICKKWLEEEIKTMELTKLSFIEDVSDREWRHQLMLNVLKDFLAVDCSIYSSAGMPTQWLKDEYEFKRQQIRDIAYED